MRLIIIIAESSTLEGIIGVHIRRVAKDSRSPRRNRRLLRTIFTVIVFAMVAAGCGDSSDSTDSTPDPATDSPMVLATTGIWADVVSNLACDGIADVEAIIPVGGDPHGFEPSLQDRERMDNADLVVANGLQLETRLLDTLEAVENSGTPVFAVAEHVESIPFFVAEDDHDDHDDHDEEGHEDHDDHDEDHEDHDDHDEEGHEDHDEEGHEDHDDHDEEGHEDHDEEGHEDHDDHDDEGDEDHDGHDHHGHDHGSEDPHVWFDPTRVSAVLDELAQHLIDDAGVDRDAIAACLSDYQAELEALDHELEDLIEQLPAGKRKLVTNHDALGYFADRYGFEIIGTVLPSISTLAETNPAQLEELAHIIEHEGVNAIFGETVHSSDDAEALAARIGDVKVVTLYTGSLGPPGSGAEDYVGFMRTNARLIVDALS